MDHGQAICNFLAGVPHFSAREVERCQGPITIEAVIFQRPSDKSPGLDAVRYEFYKCMSELLGDLLSSVYAN